MLYQLSYASGGITIITKHRIETPMDRWLMDNRDEINVKIRRGIAQLDRDEGIPEDQLDAYLTEQKAKPE